MRINRRITIKNPSAFNKRGSWKGYEILGVLVWVARWDEAADCSGQTMHVACSAVRAT